MQVPIFKAKDINSGKECTGFYFQYPKTTYCCKEDYLKETVDDEHCLITHVMTDWGLPNKPVLIVIDKNTLEKIGEVEVYEVNERSN